MNRLINKDFVAEAEKRKIISLPSLDELVKEQKETKEEIKRVGLLLEQMLKMQSETMKRSIKTKKAYKDFQKEMKNRKFMDSSEVSAVFNISRVTAIKWMRTLSLEDKTYKITKGYGSEGTVIRKATL